MPEVNTQSCVRIHVDGIVQGVGFRPFVYGLALRHDLGGWVLNSSSGVDIELLGEPDAVNAFLRALEAEGPPLAQIDRIDVADCPEEAGSRGTGQMAHFEIRHSQDHAGAFVPISPDIATCDDCLEELFDSNNLRYRYPFINCTNCGPRFTILRDIPYDRPMTTMGSFPMCPVCQAEYEDPSDRRFHAQPNACPVCGPQVKLIPSPARGNNTVLDGPIYRDDAVIATCSLLDAGLVVAVKGLGGYHLACDATKDDSVERLRERKGRVDKPFAVMAADLDAVRSFATISDDEADLLTSRQRPIVLVQKRNDCWLCSRVAPGNRRIGVMLPYTPLHHLLLHGDTENRSKPRVYVMTSGNLSEEPIVKDDDEALARLAPLADAFLQHDRAIHIHCDDSVVRSFGAETMPIRRARGYAPSPINLPAELPPVLAVGGELKNTFCLTNGRYAFMSQHIGDMENLETLQAFEHTVYHYTKVFRVQPTVVACDMHPAYLSTRWAAEYARETGLPLIQVQHHHAHIAALMAEHGLTADEQVIGVALDGTGYGPDETIWGGEILVGTYAKFTRAGRIRPVPLPGGDAAIRRPYRIALAYLWDADVAWHDALPPVAVASAEELRILPRQLETGINVTPTSSMGRLFDAVASIAGVRQSISYEAQAAMELEALAATDDTALPYSLEQAFIPPPDTFRALVGGNGPTQKSENPESVPGLHSVNRDLQFDIDARPLVRQVAADVTRGVSSDRISARFHKTIAVIVRESCRRVRAHDGLDRVALSGGVFQNLLLLRLVVDLLQADGFDVLIHRRVPANDGGIALGQALIAHYGTRN